MREHILDVGAPVCEFCVDLVASIAAMNSRTKSSIVGRKGFAYAYISMSLKLRQDPEASLLVIPCRITSNWRIQSSKYSRSHGECCL